MTFEEFRDEAFRLCQEVAPGRWVRVEHGAAMHGGVPSNEYVIYMNLFGSTWSARGEIPSHALYQLKQEIERHHVDPVFARTVAEAMGLVVRIAE